MALPADFQPLLDALPIENAAQLDHCDGVPVFRAPRHVVVRIEELLLDQQSRPLSQDERNALDRYESLDDFLSFVNRLVRNAFHDAEHAAGHSASR